MKLLQEELRETEQRGIGFQKEGLSQQSQSSREVSDVQQKACLSNKFLSYVFRVFEIKLNQVIP